MPVRKTTHWLSGRSLLALSLTFVASAAIGQQVPSAGSQLQQVRPAPEPSRNEPEIRIERPEAQTVSQSMTNNETTIVVNALRVAGATRFSEQELVAATQFKAGEAVSLGTLSTYASEIAAHYRAHGYFLAQAFVPPQDVKGGVVTIAVMEGRYGRVQVRNRSRLSDSSAEALISALHEGDAVDMSTLETSLLLLSDLPGIEVRSTLTPGSSVGATDLIIDVAPGRTFTGNLEADNFGGRYTGEYRFGGMGSFNNPFGKGDVASLRLLSSLDGFGYGRAAYQLAFDRLTLGAAYTALDYELGEEFASLEAHGTADIGSLYIRFPLVRRRHANLSVIANVESKAFKDELDITTPSIITRKRTEVASISLVGDRKTVAETAGRSGLGTFSFTWTSGRLDLLDAQALNGGGAEQLNEGRYDKAGLTVTYLHPLGKTLSIHTSIRGQLSPDALDVSEKLSLGGAHGVRAFPEGEAYVDDGYVVAAEVRARIDTSRLHLPGRWEAIGFAESGSGRSSSSDGRRTLSGAGLGLNGSFSDIHVRASYAHTVGGEKAISTPESDSCFWFNVVKFF